MIARRPESIGSRVRDARLAAGLSQSMLERKSGIPKSMLSRYENDHLLPSLRTLRRLADAIGIAASELIETEDTPPMLDRELARRGVRFGSHAEMMRVADMICDELGESGKPAGSIARRGSP